MKLEFSRQIFENYSNTKFHENPSNGSRVVQRGRTDMMKLTIALREVAKASNNIQSVPHREDSVLPKENQNLNDAEGSNRCLLQECNVETKRVIFQC
jgi:hypothetical protein